MTRKAFGYTRVSTDQQARSGLGLESQREKIVAYCEVMGYSLENIHSDEGVSGRSLKGRPGLGEALDAACEARGVLVAFDLSRVARSVRDAVAISERLMEHEADLALVDMNMDTATATGRCTFAIIAAVGQLESDISSERTRRALATARARGVKLGRKPKLTGDQKAEIVVRFMDGEKGRDLAKEYGVHEGTIYRLTARRK